MLIIKCLLIGWSVMASIIVLLFGPAWYRAWNETAGPIYARWWRMMGRRKVLGTLSGIGFGVLVVFAYWLFSFAA